MSDSFYQAFGIVTSAYARMESEIRMFIAGLVFSDDTTTASVFLDSSQLRDNLNSLKKIGRQSDYEEEIKSLGVIPNQLRETRNLFIHGIWSPNTFSEKGGYAFVRDLKTKFEHLPKGGKRWTTGESEQFRFEDFNAIHDQIMEFLEESEILRSTIEEENSDIQFCSLMGDWREFRESLGFSKLAMDRS